MSDVVPYKAQLALLKEVAPTVRVVGMVYNPGESNAVFGIEQSRLAAEGLGMEIITAAAHNTNEVQAAFRGLADRVDAFYTGSDNTVAAAIAAAIAVATEYKKPFLCADTGTVDAGGLITLGVNYIEVGRLTADLAKRVLDGEKPANLPVVTAPGTELVVNIVAAQKLGLSIPAPVLAKATRVVR